jgi:uncharacterized coiled-coil protein SlyX
MLEVPLSAKLKKAYEDRIKKLEKFIEEQDKYIKELKKIITRIYS